MECLKAALENMPVPEMLVDKQPSVAITIQKEYSYSFGLNLSFVTYRNQSDCLRCINLYPSHTSSWRQHLEIIIDPVAALWVVRVAWGVVFLCGMPFSRSVGRFRWSSWWQCSRNTVLPSGPLPPGSICLAQVLLHTESPVKQTQSQ